MADNVFKTRGQTKAASPEAGDGVTRSLPVFGIVKSNVDTIRSGRLQVYIENFGSSNPDDSNAWITVAYMTPFYGVTNPTAPDKGFGDYVGNPSSYGMWYAPPDIGSKVICIFINGDPNYGFWIGCVPEPEALTMVPAIGSSDNVIMNEGEATSYGGATRLPVTNMNTNAPDADSQSFLNTAKPVHSYAASILAQQGLIRDPVRGTIGTSSQRESPSRVGWGVSTPGRPIYQGGFNDDNLASNAKSANKEKLQMLNRRAGHSIVMDDGDITGKDQLIRLRTSLGHQILMSDDGQTLFIIHSNGQSYIELGKEGTIDMYSTNSVNIRTQGDLNLHADNNININAMKDLNIAAQNINYDVQTDVNFRVGANFNSYVIGQYALKVNGNMSSLAGGEASIASAGTVYVTGPSAVNLNTGSASLVPAEVGPIPIIAQTDTLFSKEKGYAAAPGKLMTIVSRAPAHAPWANANQGVDVKVSTDADDALPSAPSAPTAATNAATAGTPTAPVTPALVATVPSVGAVSGAITAGATSSLVSAAAVNAATNAANVVKAGAGAIPSPAGLVAAAGSLAQPAVMMEKAGFIKPGASAVMNTIVSQGTSATNAMTDNLFTGKPGGQTLATFVNNTSAQVQTQVTNLQQAQSSLTSVGLMTGKESASQVAGLVNSAATAGVGATVDLVKSVAGDPTKALGSLTGAAGDAAKAMTAGNFAANLQDKVTGGLGSISTSLGGLKDQLSSQVDKAKGVAAGAFSAITASFKSFTPGVPQNLKAIAEKAAAESGQSTSAAASGSGAGLLPGGLGAIASSATSALGNIPGASALTNLAKNAASAQTNGISLANSASTMLSSVTGSATNAVNSVTGSVSGLLPTDLAGATRSLTGAATSLTSLTRNIPGAGGLTNTLQGATGALNSLTAGASGLSNILKGGSIPGLGTKSLTSLVSAGLPAGLSAQLGAAINSLSSGGPVPIKMPVIGADTNNRTGLVAQITSVLGNAKIPAPNFNRSLDAQKAESDRLSNLLEQQYELVKQREAQDKAIETATKEMEKLRDTLPAGDPQIAEAVDKINSEIDKFNAINAKIRAIADSATA